MSPKPNVAAMTELELIDWCHAHCEGMTIIFVQPDNWIYVSTWWWDPDAPNQYDMDGNMIYTDIGGPDRLSALRNAVKLTWYRIFKPDAVVEHRPEGSRNTAQYLDESDEPPPTLTSNSNVTKRVTL